ncbi:resuscitation-promoting factor Rpf1 domain-containing protein [Rhodococcus sp. NPDC058521]|uniref:resuscitation-promoting factor Rpf1 domain-containing protein n=1 Tax=Rhodococcus sp. NPDC058521 TaxID=3346536 RepID=UPI003651FFCB
MTGRHRKPTNTGRTVAKVAVTGAIMGVAGAAFSGTANAAPDSDWDRLAQCESGGNWGINTGNGFQGGLQFSPSTWSAHGGDEYAATANNASREQQIVVAERVLESQGWGAWPSCSSSLGLSSGVTQRDAPATTPDEPEAQEAPAVPELPDLTSVPSTEDAAPYLDAVNTALETVKQQGIEIDPQVLDFIEANKGLLAPQ